MRGCGCIERPAFPAPSEFSDALQIGKTRAGMRGEIAEVRVLRGGFIPPPPVNHLWGEDKGRRDQDLLVWLFEIVIGRLAQA